MSVETVLITGASSGIGRELAKCFAADGCRLVLLARKRHALQELADELRKAHKTQSEILPADLTEPSAPGNIFAHLQRHGTKVDVLVNNAGFGAQGQFAQLPADRQLDMLQVNITALTHLTRLLLPAMISRRHGGVLNVASTAAFQPGPGMAVYYATKAFVLSFTVAHKDSGKMAFDSHEVALGVLHNSFFLERTLPSRAITTFFTLRTRTGLICPLASGANGSTVKSPKISRENQPPPSPNILFILSSAALSAPMYSILLLPIIQMRRFALPL